MHTLYKEVEMIHFPLRIELYQAPGGLWRAHTVSDGIGVSAVGESREWALGSIFLRLREIPGFQLWTFVISSADGGENAQLRNIPTPSAHVTEPKPKPSV